MRWNAVFCTQTLSNGRKTGERRGFTGEPCRNVKESALRYHVSDEGNNIAYSFSLSANQLLRAIAKRLNLTFSIFVSDSESDRTEPETS